ncbi:SIS domain-containing protein [Massilia sp. FT127W]|uniref:SIS domain-containing protein n=2 Tax=Pseudoduganella aquatica TaxID=2660641 RepID=A0A7X4KKH8_9BURK|nr:SIS domain-containing protein [Pseudoduganella aquatica]
MTMTQALDLASPQWEALGGQHTAREIAQQPAVWRQLAAALLNEEKSEAAGISAGISASNRARLHALLADPSAQAILTGAGTSSFIGELAADGLNGAWPAQVRAVATTSLLSHPALYLAADKPLLLVSFARSGNSPESQAVVDVVRAKAPGALFLHITCNAEGALARDGDGRSDTITLLLPPATCDRSFAMTSSFTTMLLAALSLLEPAPLAQAARRIESLAVLADRWLDTFAAEWRELGSLPLSRIVYLGGAALEGLAQEAALKVLELTAGQVLAMPNTPLGFRHGPKSMLNRDTLVVLFHSQDAHARLYEHDLLAELRRDQVAGHVAALDGSALGAPEDLSDAWLAAAYVLLAQTLALHQSVRLGLTPDNPFPDGTVNRVVQGVTVYAHEAI